MVEHKQDDACGASQSDAELSAEIGCSVRGLIAPGMMCGFVIVGGMCGHGVTGFCPFKIMPLDASAGREGGK